MFFAFLCTCDRGHCICVYFLYGADHSVIRCLYKKSTLIERENAMHRKDREYCEKEFLYDVLTRAEDFVLALATDAAPYVVPLNFVLLDDALYFHCALEGRKLDCLAVKPEVGFTAFTDVRIVQEKSTTYFKSVCGTGRAELVLDDAEKGRALDALSCKYHSRCPVPTPEAMLKRTAVVRISIESLSGKGNMGQQA
jgi:uncharacterized protein